MKPAVLFDIDGTLLYAKGIGRIAFAEAFKEAYGVTADCSQISFVGATDSAVIRTLAEAYHVATSPAKEEHFAIVLTKVLDDLLRQPGAIAVYPGIPDLLRRLTAAGITLGIVTGNIRATAWSKLIHAQLAPYFTFGSYACDHHDRNQLAKIACQRAASLGLKPCALLGDTPRDVLAAHAAGLPCLAYENGWVPHEAFVQAGAEAICTSWEPVDEIIAQVEAWIK